MNKHRRTRGEGIKIWNKRSNKSKEDSRARIHGQREANDI